VDRPHRLKDFLNELFGVRHTPAPLPVIPPATEHAPDLNVGPETPEPSTNEVRITISPDAVTVGDRDTVAGPLIGEMDFCVRGCVNGDICTKGSVLVTGLVKGNVTAASIWAQGGELCGDLTAGAGILLDKDSLVIGELCADVIDIAGHVEGGVRSKSRTLIRSTAILTGDLETKSALIEPGAAIEGKVRITD